MGYEQLPPEPGTPAFQRWATTNMDYGRFYGGQQKSMQHLQEDIGRNVHVECEKKFETLERELEECKSQIELLRGRTCQIEPVPDELNPSSPALLLCEGQSNSRKKLEATCSPSSRVSTPVNNRRPSSQETIPEEDTKDLETSEGEIRRSRISRKNKQLPPVVPRDKNPETKAAVFDRLARPKTAPPTITHSRTSRSNKGDPATSKYDYYKYYGSAGQGAKTSWRHNLPLGTRPPYGIRSHGGG